jgi:hypothetical protein
MNGASPTLRSKRKEPPHTVDGRHPKHHRANGELSAADANTPDMHEEMEEDYEELDPRTAALLPTGADTAEWQETIQNVVRNVVSIRFCQTCSFDTDSALTSEATGFVVDAERG